MNWTDWAGIVLLVLYVVYALMVVYLIVNVVRFWVWRIRIKRLRKKMEEMGYADRDARRM